MFLSHPWEMENSIKNYIIENAKSVQSNLSSEQLYDLALEREEGKSSIDGALVCLLYTSPSPRDGW